jgi:hypothetical protein
MARTRITTGLLIAVTGTAWWAGAINTAAGAVIAAAPFMLIIWALAAATRAMAPRGVLVGPAVLATSGAVWLIARGSVVGAEAVRQIIPLLLILGGFAVALSGGGREPQHFDVRRFRTILYPCEFILSGKTPRKISVLSFLFPATLDLSRVTAPVESVVEVDVTTLAGRVVIVLPSTWAAVAGRIYASGVRFEGVLDTPVVVDDELMMAKPTAIINVLGLAGSVFVRSQPASAPG